LITNRIDAQLITGDVLCLCPIAEFEVNDRGLVRVQPPDWVDPAIHRDARCYVDLDLLFGVKSIGQDSPVFVEVTVDNTYCGAAQPSAEPRLGERGVKVSVYQFLDLKVGGDISVDCPLVHFSHYVTNRSASRAISSASSGDAFVLPSCGTSTPRRPDPENGPSPRISCRLRSSAPYSFPSQKTSEVYWHRSGRIR
jgi:hypothetical protein